MAVKRMSTYRQAAPGAGIDEWGDPIPGAGVSLGVPDYAPVWVSPAGERVAVRFTTSRTRPAAIERVARHIAQRPQLVIGWRWSSGTSAAFLRYRGWRLLPDDERR